MTPAPPVPLRLHHFGLSVADLEASISWYERHLGFTRLYDYPMPDPSAKVAFIARDGYRIELFEVEGSAPLPAGRRELASDLKTQGLKHLAFRVDDVAAAAAAFRARGVEIATPVMPVPGSDGERFAFFRDDTGVLIELYEAKLHAGEAAVPDAVTASAGIGGGPGGRPFGIGWMAEYFTMVDRMDTREFVSWYAEDGRFRFGNAAPAVGRAAIAAALDGFYATIDGMAHRRTGAWADAASGVWEAEVAFRTKAGGTVVVPAVSVVRVGNDGLVRDFRMVVDVAPLSGEARA